MASVPPSISPNAAGQHAAFSPLPLPALLPLESGDRLTRAEFERRYDGMPDLKKAELIDGVVYMGSPVRTSHGSPHAVAATWLGTYMASTPGVALYDNTTVRLDDENEPQPDLALLKDARCGGQARIDDDGYIAGPPKLVVEIAASSASRDAHLKKELYRRFGVAEYILWRVYDAAIDWFVLRDGQFEPLPPDSLGRIQSVRFPGLWLDVGAMLRHDLRTVLEVLRLGTSSPAHAEFVKLNQPQA